MMETLTALDLHGVRYREIMLWIDTPDRFPQVGDARLMFTSTSPVCGFDLPTLWFVTNADEYDRVAHRIIGQPWIYSGMRKGSRRRRQKAREVIDATLADLGWRLNDEEEALLQVVKGSLTQGGARAS